MTDAELRIAEKEWAAALASDLGVAPSDVAFSLRYERSGKKYFLFVKPSWTDPVSRSRTSSG